MPNHQSNGVQFVGGFLASVMAAYWIRRRDAGERRIKAQIYGAVGNAFGLFIGCKLAERAEQ